MVGVPALLGGVPPGHVREPKGDRHPPSAPGCRPPGPGIAAEQGSTFPDAEQAVRTAGRRGIRRLPGSVVDDLHVDQRVGVGQPDGCLVSLPGMLEGVGQRFLHDPVDRGLPGFRNGKDVPGDQQ